MAYPPKLVLQVPLSDEALLEPFVEACLRDHAELIAVVGEGCERIHDLIDDVIIGDGSDDERYIATTWHDDETLAEVLEFAEIFDPPGGDGVQLVKL